MIINGNGLHILQELRKNRQTTQLATAKLVSGKQITKAADDAAGLAISEKLRALMIGSNQAVRNIQDGKSLLKTADSAMMEMSDVVQRIRELTIQAMNAPLTDIHSSATHADTLIIQKEIDALKKNLNDIVIQTQFNTRQLLTQPDAKTYETIDKQITSTISRKTSQKTYDVQSLGNLQKTVSNVTKPDKHTIQGVQAPPKKTPAAPPTTEKLTTVNDHTPRFSQDGQTIIFESTRQPKTLYEMPLDGERVVKEATNTRTSPQKTTAGDYSLVSSNHSLLIVKKDKEQNIIERIPVNNYGYQNGPNGYTFSASPTNGVYDLLYTTSEGNIAKQRFDAQKGVLRDYEELIPSTDTLHLPPKNNFLGMKRPPELYRMNTDEASLVIKKHNDDGARTLTYWDQVGPKPASGYFVEGTKIEFFGDAIIGNESIDDAQDYYTFQYVGDGAVDDVFVHHLPTATNFYNVHGEKEGPVAIKVTIGDRVVPREQYLSERPAPGEQPHGIYIDEKEKKVYVYGDLRPNAYETVVAHYLSDVDDDDAVHTIQVAKRIDSYNFGVTDPNVEKPLRVFVGNREVHYDESKTNGFTYDRQTGIVSIYGKDRPNLLAGEKASVLYVPPTNPERPDMYEIALSRRPQIYNLGDTTGKPQSIRLTTASGKMIPYDATKTNGFYYNEKKNTIELYGNARPSAKTPQDYAATSVKESERYHERYTIHYVYQAADIRYTDEKVEVSFKDQQAETYSRSPEDYARSIELSVNGKIIPYDATKMNGFIFNDQTKKFEIYGNARPDPKDGNVIRYRYVQEQEVATIQNGTYDFTLPKDTATYGVLDASSPRAIRVFGPDGEIALDEENGFTFNDMTKQIALHGASRPSGSSAPDTYQVFAVSSNDLSTAVPRGSIIHQVTFRGETIPLATEDAPHGYIFQDGRVQLVGDARPDVTKDDTRSSGLRVDYIAPKGISLDVGAVNGDAAYCEHETGSALPDAALIEDSVQVTVNGQLLSNDAFYITNDTVHLHYDRVPLLLRTNDVSIDYQVKQGKNFDDITFVFQTGPNQNDHVHVSIPSFDKMLYAVSPICVRQYEHAEIALERADEALHFISTALGTVGALMNRLDHNEQNVRVSAEQLTSALSRIEDADMAEVMVTKVKASILEEAQLAMIAHYQTNESRVLELIQS